MPEKNLNRREQRKRRGTFTTETQRHRVKRSLEPIWRGGNGQPRMDANDNEQRKTTSGIKGCSLGWGGIRRFYFGNGPCDTYGPKGIPEGIGIILGPFITGAPDAVLHALGYGLKPMPTMLAWLNGWLFGVTINFLVGAAVSSVLAVGLRLLSNRLKMRRAGSPT